MKSFIFLLFVLISLSAFGQGEGDKRTLEDEVFLHPGDMSTAYTFGKGEFSYNQALTPFPSWAWWGITDRITTEIDLEAWLGGVPSLNVRVSLLGQKGVLPAVAYETMFQYIPKEIDLFENLEAFSVLRERASWYNHVNMSWRCGQRLYVHASGGFTYAEDVRFVGYGEKGQVEKEKGYVGRFHPDMAVGVDWRRFRHGSFHASVLYGSSFLYADNIPRKLQYSFSSRVAPFIDMKAGFLNAFRFEVAFLHMDFADVDRSVTGPMGFVYWQWQLFK